MNKHSDQTPEHEVEQEAETASDPEETLRRLLDDEGGHDTFNPRTGEDPGALPLTEDPLERRMKRTTM